MENMRKRIKIRIVKSSQDFMKYTSRPNALIGKYLKTIQLQFIKKISLTLNKPLYVGFTVFEISKWEMYNFHYDFMIRKFNTRLRFLTQAVYVMNFMKTIHTKKCTSTKNYLI